MKPPIIAYENVTLALRPIDKDADVYTLAEFEQYCKNDSFIDYDGFGEFATATHRSGIKVTPSDITERERGWWVRVSPWTHVVWFNK